MTEIPGYSIQRILGRGGMATVYLAVQESLGREVALKVLVSSEAKDPTAHERFLREARIAASLHHPHIVPIHDFGLHGDLAYIAMEYEPGGSVAPMPGGRLGPCEALKIIRDIAGALEYAHGRGVVHRDIKPDNLLRRGDGAAVLSDFGIARLIDAASLLTTEGTSVGTPHYMSPEQLRGEKVDGRSDLYSLGVVLWQLLTGELPYNGTDAWAIGTQHLTADIPCLPDGLTHLQPLLDSLLAKKPQARIQTGAELAQRAEALLTTVVTPDTVPSVAAYGHGDPGASPSQQRRTPDVPLQDRRVTAAALPSATGTRNVAIGMGVVLLVVLGWMGWRHFAPSAHAPSPATVASATGTGAASAAAAAAAAAAQTPAAAHASLAVLALKDLSPGGDQAYFSDGMAEELQSRLAQVPGLQVAGRSSSQSFKGKDATVAQIGKALGVDNVLAGSERKDGDRLRVTMQLSNAATGFQTWTQSYDRKLTDVFAVQDDIATAVVDSLKLTLLNHGSTLGARRHTPRFEVYDAYLRGRQALTESAPGSVEKALLSYRSAVKLDPEYADAWSGLAMAESFAADNGIGKDSAEGSARAHAAAQRAVQLDPTLGDAYATRGYLRTRAWDWDGALADVRKSIELDPRDGRNQLRYGYLLATLHRLPEAKAALQEGTRVDPLLTPVWQWLGLIEAAQGDFVGAERDVQHALSIDPTFDQSLALEPMIQLLQGRADKARALFLKRGNASGVMLADYTLDPTLATRARIARELAGKPWHDSFRGVRVSAWIGDLDTAFVAIDKLIAAKDGGMLSLSYEPALANLRGDPRYAAARKRMGLPAQDN